MKINAELVKSIRQKKFWTQDELAIAAGLNARTIQRVEKEATASLQTKKALASALDINIHSLDFEESIMKICSVCKSSEVYKFKKFFEYSAVGEELLPKASSSMFGTASICPFVCVDCGHISLMASSEARNNISNSSDWEKL